jgi:predicted DCC family thiol-disulfide oxidoreductase YuxK
MSSVSPDARIIVYDGHCYLCSGWARFHHRHPVNPPFKLVAMQSEDGGRFCSRTGLIPMTR